MTGMLASSRNRSVRRVDGNNFDDGFWTHRRFHGNRRSGSPTGGRGWRRVLRKKEKNEIRNQIINNQM